MFDARDLQMLDWEYFEVMQANEYDVMVISKNTRYIWLIHNAGYLKEGDCVIFHAHSLALPYHQHGRVNSLRHAIRSIKGYDWWQMNRENRNFGLGMNPKPQI